MSAPLRTPPRGLRRLSDRPDEAFDDSIEVPAAVVCAVCGDAECGGCETDALRSQILTVVAWERPGMPRVAALWATARATTLKGESFFELLPDGPIAPALRFALVTETIAATCFVVTVLPFVFVAAPAWVRHVALDAAARDVALRTALVGIPGLALLLVAAHVAHGLALDRGARVNGGRGAPSRALRFGLYATGWDLVLGPLGALVVALREGGRAAAALGRIGAGLPGRCSRGFLRGTYRLEGRPADRANRTGMIAAAVATFVGAVAILAVAIRLALL